MNASSGRLVGTTLTARMQKVSEEMEALNRVKAPYARKAMVIRSAKLQKALYGCEVAPANEGCLRTLRTRIAKTLTYTTEHRSADLTFATCSHGPDLDPDILFLSKRAVAFRRYYTRTLASQEAVAGDGGTSVRTRRASRGSVATPSEADGRIGGAYGSSAVDPSATSQVSWKEASVRHGKLARAIYRKYQQLREPGIHKAKDETTPKYEGGDPATPARAASRKPCRPLGPIGLLLESVHLQSAAIDQQWRVRQYNQQPIDIVDGSAHTVAPLLTRFAARNRTRRAEGQRSETQGLLEVDTYATNAKHPDRVPDDKMIVLRLVQSGSG